MQIIARTKQGPEAYIKQEAHYRMRPPGRCPHCQQPKTLWSLGYYARSLAGKADRYLKLYIRRFRCRLCRKTVSLLPHFAQPYRLIRNRVITLFIAETHRRQTARWTEILRRYWRRFCAWHKTLVTILVMSWGRSPPTENPLALWRWLEDFYGGLDNASDALIGELQITFFGRYRCHQPNLA